MAILWNDQGGAGDVAGVAVSGYESRLDVFAMGLLCQSLIDGDRDGKVESWEH